MGTRQCVEVICALARGVDTMIQRGVQLFLAKVNREWNLDSSTSRMLF